MVAIMITLDILHIGRCKLNLNEYLTLLKIKHNEEDKSFPFEIDPRFIPRLIKDGFILCTDEINCTADKYQLGPTSAMVFETNDLFEEFYTLFPNSVDTGSGRRAISAKDPNSISGRVTHDIWNRVTKGKPSLQEKIIVCLKRELDNRKANGSLAYLQGIDTWLRQATWEKWEDIPDKNSSKGYIKL